MRLVVRVLVAAVVLLAVGLGALYALLPGMVESPAVRERIEQAAREATGRAFHYEDLSFGVFPPRLVVEGPRLAGEAAGEPPFAEAQEVSLEVAFWPLLARSLVLESLVVEGATVRLVRDAGGLRLPEPERDGRPAAGAPGARGGGEGEDAVALAVQELALRDARVLFEDRSVRPPAKLEIEDLDAIAVLSADAPAKIQLDAELGGGRLSVDGRADWAAQAARWTATLDGVGLAVLAPYLPEGQEAAGRLSGTVQGEGAFASPGLAAELTLRQGVVRISDIGLEGPLRLRADLSGEEPRSGSFDLDATDAALDAYGGAFRKAAGKPGTVKGRLVPKAGGGFDVDDVELKIHDLDARGRIETGDPVRAELTAQPIDLAGWGEILPALAAYQPAGTLRPGTLRIASEPLSVRGRIGLDGVRLTLPDGPQIGLEGALEGTGDALKLVNVALTTGGQRVRIAGLVAGLAQPQRSYHLALGADGAEANTLLSAFTAVRDRVFGALSLDTDLSGRTGDPQLETLAGHLRFAIHPGKIKDVSLLRLTVQRLGTFGEAALLAAALDKPARLEKIERFYGDSFEELAGSFDVAKGWARTRDLRLVYPSYRVDLQGGIRLRDRRLDFSGTLTLDRDVDEALAGASGGTAAERPRVIQLAEVQGTLDSPRVGLSSHTVRAWVDDYAGGKIRDEVQGKLDDKLGKELGGDVGDLVDGLFGGRR